MTGAELLALIEQLREQVAHIGDEEAEVLSNLRKQRIPFVWSGISITFNQGQASSVSLSSYIANPQGYTLTYSVTGTLPSGVTLSGEVLSYNGLGAIGSASVVFTATNGTWSAVSASSSVTVAALAADTTAPSVPTGLAAVVASSTQINLSWNASADPFVAGQVQSGLASYRIYRNSTLFTTVTSPTTTYQNAGLLGGTTYSYSVAAVDAAGNASAQTSTVNATTNPTVGSDGAFLSGSALTINLAAGGFGTKSVPAPYRFFPLQNDANGTDSRNISGLTQSGSIVGMEQYNLDYGDRWTTVQTGENVWGKDLVYTVTSDGMTPAMGSLMSPNVSLVYGSFWMKIVRPNTTSAQWKGPRGGNGSSTNGNVNYAAGGVKFHHELYCGTSGVFDDIYPGWNDSGGGSHQGANEVDGPASFKTGLNNLFGQWHCWQFLNSCGSSGASDGFSYMWCDGAMILKKTNLAVTLSGSSALIQNQQYITGLQNVTLAQYTIRCSRPFCDTTIARVELINAATYSAATGFLILRPTVWTDTRIEVPDIYCLSVPSGYNWCAVTNSSGTTTVMAIS